MNPAKISIPDCTLDTPVKKSSGKISFCLLPCLHNNERLQVKLATRFKIFSHQEDSFSLGITLPEENIKFFKNLETHLNALATKRKSEVKEIGPNFARYQQGANQNRKRFMLKSTLPNFPTQIFHADFGKFAMKEPERNRFPKRKNLSTFLSGGKLSFP